ncbi:MAG: molybdate ABC transporter substrate-binding protein, partial [Alphaproteobacteria bacterium]|nr:molybdate ABC transporter substrate-binding protein [Alphaproteobacteria bacterium]
GSSVQLAQQIESGAPFEVFLSADREQPERLVKMAKADAGSLFTYADGELVLLVPRAEAAKVRSITDLRDAAVKHVAIANPAHAPYGRAAVAALRSAKMYDEISPKLAVAENVAQAAQFVLTGNADAGLVSATAKAAAGERAVAYPVASDLYPAIHQGAVLTEAGAKSEAAKAFLSFMRTPEAQRVLSAHGLRPAR